MPFFLDELGLLFRTTGLAGVDSFGFSSLELNAKKATAAMSATAATPPRISGRLLDGAGAGRRPLRSDPSRGERDELAERRSSPLFEYLALELLSSFLREEEREEEALFPDLSPEDLLSELREEDLDWESSALLDLDFPAEVFLLILATFF